MSEAVLSVDILTNTSTLTSGMQAAGNSVKAFGADTALAAVGTDALTAALDLLQASFAPLLALASVAGIIAGIGAQFSAISDVGRSAKQLGTTAEQFSAMAYAAKRSGVEIEDFTQGMQHFNRTLGEAELGSDEASKKFNKLGIDFTKLGKLEFGDQVRSVAEKISKLGSVAQQTAATTELYGKSMANMVPFLAQGAAGIDKFVAAAKASGQIVSGESVAQYKQFTSAIKEIKEVATSVFRSLAVAIAPALAAAGSAIKSFIEWGKALFDEWKPVFVQIYDIWRAGITAIQELFAPLWAVIKEMFNDFLQLWGIDLKEIMNNAKDYITYALTAIEYTIKNWKESALTLFEAYKLGVISMVNDVSEALTGSRPFEEWENELKKSLGNMLGHAKEGFDKLLKMRMDALHGPKDRALGHGTKDISGQVGKDDKEKGAKNNTFGFLGQGSIEAANAIVKSMREGDKPQVRLLEDIKKELQGIRMANFFGNANVPKIGIARIGEGGGGEF